MYLVERDGPTLQSPRDVSVAGIRLDIVPIGDMHVGSRGCSEGRIEAAVERGTRPNTVVMLMGDYIEAIYMDDKRFDPGSIDPRMPIADLIPSQFRRAMELLKPLCPVKGKPSRCLGALLGNHEKKWLDRFGLRSVFTTFCDQVGVEEMDYVALFDVRIWFADPHGQRRKHGKPWDAKVRVFAHHGAGSAATPGGKLNKPLSSVSGLSDDVGLVLWGHSHAQSTWSINRIGGNKDCTEVVDHSIPVCLTGGFLRGYPKGASVYSEMKGYPPLACGAPVIHVYPDLLTVETLNPLRADCVGTRVESLRNKFGSW